MKNRIPKLLKMKLSITIIALLLLSSISVVLAESNDGLKADDTNKATERIEIALDSVNMKFVEGIPDIDYCAEVKYVVNNNIEDILAPTQVAWSTDNTNIFKYCNNGLIIPKSEGTATIFAEYNGMKDSINVNVAKGSITDLKMSEKKIKLNGLLYKLGDQNPYKLTALVMTSLGSEYDITDKCDIKWESSNESVATVSNGRVYTVNPGTAVVTASYLGFSASTDITVTNPKIKSSKAKLTAPQQVVIEDEKGVELMPLMVEFDDGSTEDFSKIAKVESSNSNVAMGSEGFIYAFKEGNAVMTVNYLGYVKTINVKVNKSDPKKMVSHPIP